MSEALRTVPAVDYSRRLVNMTDPAETVNLNPPRHAVVTSETYGGATVSLPVVVIQRSPAPPAHAEWLCVRQRLEAELEWLAWVPAERVRPT